MEKTLESCLSNERVIIRFYKRKKGNSTIDNPKHVAHGGMLETATKELVPPMLRSGQRKNILTDSEKEFLEDYMQLPKGSLSVYNKEFWNKRKVILRKEDNIFDLSDPDNYIDYKIALANANIVAPSFEDIDKKATYSFYIEREGESEARQVKTLTIKQEAYKLFGKYEENEDILRYILSQAGKHTAKNSKIKSLIAWTGEVIEDKPNVFVSIASDPLLKTKVFINKAVDLGVVTINNNEYFDSETGKPICHPTDTPTLDRAATFLNEPRQQEYKLILEARVKNSK